MLRSCVDLSGCFQGVVNAHRGHPIQIDATRWGGRRGYSALPKFAARNPNSTAQCRKTLAVGHSRCDQAAGKRRPSSAKSHRPPTADAVVVTELSGGARASCEQSHHGCAEHCVPRRPADVPTPREQKKNRVRAHTHTDSQTCRERDGRKKNNVARGSCLLHDVVGQQMEITSSIDRKCEDGQLEMDQTSNCRR